MINPRTVLFPAWITSPFTLVPAELPSNSIIGVPGKSGWVVPSMMTGLVMVGSGEVGRMERTPLPGILKVIVSIAAFALAALIASRRLQWVVLQVPSLRSLVVFT